MGERSTYDIYITINGSDDFPVAGTSAATPLWAGFMALVNQAAAAKGQPPIGFANPALYAIGKSTNYHSCFHDITTGNNFTSTSPSKYSATNGYDLCTGWGTIIGSNLLQALLAPPAENLVITPPLGFTSSGPGGGPFTVASQTYTLTNIGSGPVALEPRQHLLLAQRFLHRGHAQSSHLPRPSRSVSIRRPPIS